VFVVSTDGIRLSITSGLYPKGAEYDHIQPIVQILVRTALAELIVRGDSVAIDATNITRASRKAWVEFAKQQNPNIKIRAIWFDGNFDSPQRWINERGYTEEEYYILREKLVQSVEKPDPSETEPIFIIQDERPKILYS